MEAGKNRPSARASASSIADRARESQSSASGKHVPLRPHVSLEQGALHPRELLRAHGLRGDVDALAREALRGVFREAETERPRRVLRHDEEVHVGVRAMVAARNGAEQDDALYPVAVLRLESAGEILGDPAEVLHADVPM